VMSVVLLGILLCLVLALVLDGLILLGNRWLTPWQRLGTTPGREIPEPAATESTENPQVVQA